MQPGGGPILKRHLDSPTEPGVYKMLNTSGEVLYVGKAKNLRKRLASYFLKKKDRDLKTTVLLMHVDSVETIVTRTEDEALILERQLIRTLQPRYNILLKDDKNYPYIKVTVQEPFPRLLVVRERKPDGAAYFGPYPSIGSSKFLQRMLVDLFPLRDCTQSIDLISKQPKCIKLDLEKCLGPCVLKEIKPEYDHWTQVAMMVLAGKNKQLIAQMQQEMWQLADQKRFERASIVRDRIQRLQQLQQRQWVQLSEDQHFLVWAYAENDSHHYALVQTFVEGQLLYQNGFYLEKETVLLEGFLQQAVLHFLNDQNPAMAQFPKNQPMVWLADNVFAPILEDVRRHTPNGPTVLIPKRGEKKSVMDLALKNVKLALAKVARDAMSRSMDDKALLPRMKELLHLQRLPRVMVGVDISHFQGQDIVGVAVVFKNGQPLKSHYRKFRIRCVQGQSDDPQSIAEVVERYLNHTVDSGLPDCIVVDGGKPQLNSAYRVLERVENGNKIEMIALAKRNEEIFFPGKRMPLVLPKREPVLQLLQRLRDEAHRFAITAQRSGRKKALASQLDAIKGVGPRRVGLLYQVYGTLEAIRQAPILELAKVGHMGIQVAQTIQDYLGKVDT